MNTIIRKKADKKQKTNEMEVDGLASTVMPPLAVTLILSQS